MSRTRSVLATLLVACVLAACSDDDPKPDIEDPTPSAATSSVPVSPSESTASPKLSPEETVRAWVDARNLALSTGDTNAVRALSAPGCRTCEEHIQPIESVYQAGGSFDTPGWKIDRLKVVAESAKNTKVDVAITMSAGVTIQQAGASPTPYPEDHRLMFFRLADGQSGWLISFIGYYS